VQGLQRHWYRHTPLLLVTLPLSWLFGTLAALRRLLYRNNILSSHRLPVPVIVVGNISVGGTGKTPLTLALAERLKQFDKHPIIVSRGYGGSVQTPTAVREDSEARVCGDEPLLMARRNICPVWVGRDRVATALAALQAHPECDVILCDDGLQHYRLQRDVELVVVDGKRRFGNGFLLPAGPLREPVARLHKADAVIVNGDGALSGEHTMRLHGELFHNLLNPSMTLPAYCFQGLRLHAVAGIGNPRRYFDQLQAMGLDCTEHPFADHHAYTPDELSFAECDALLLTEKDAVKCTSFANTHYWVLRVEAQIDPKLIELILRKIDPHGCKAA
jgi:tetraacyldisaccharide 4'-kinase